MIILTSPAKTLDTESGKNFSGVSVPKFSREALQLVRILKKKKKPELKALMSISDSLTETNYERYQSFQKEFRPENSNPSIFAFRGDVYQGLDVEQLDNEDIVYANDRIRILSGLYGILKPLDLMQPYRLEMGTSLENKNGKNLYAFWGDKITKVLNSELKESGQKFIFNLASKEYYKAVNEKKLKGEVITANFKEDRDGKLKFISFNAKKARGMMMRYVIKNRIEDPKELIGFDLDGYVYNEELSTDKELLFIK